MAIGVVPARLIRMRSPIAAGRQRSIAASMLAVILLGALPLEASAAVDATAPAVGTPVLSASSAAQGVPISVSVSATDGSGVVSTEVRVDGGPWTPMSPGPSADVTASRAGSGLVDASVVSLAVGAGSGCARMGGDTVWCWGANGSGQLGDGTTTTSQVPVKVTGISTARAIVVGGSFACALLSNRTVRCWGANGSGQLGNGTTSPSSTPVQVSGITTAIAVAAGSGHACAVLSGGTVRCWGANNHGQVGATTDPRTTPFAVPGITTATTVAAGSSHSCALLAAGTIRCWGYNARGQLGDGTGDPPAGTVAVSGISTATSIGAGGDHTCARLSNSSLRCWGDNHFGEVGDGATDDRLSPVAVSGISTATAVSVGFWHTCARLSSGSLKCWGDNGGGQLGDGSRTSRSTPVTVTALAGATAIAAGDGFSCAVLTDRTPRCWGTNDAGQLGYDSRTTVRKTPVDLDGITTATSLGAGLYHTCARLSSGALRCWGRGIYGELGDGTGTSSDTPVAVSGISTATKVDGGANHTCALLSGGTVKCWGLMEDGGLGNGTASSWTPVTVSGITTATALGVGRYHACAVLADGTVRCWGYNVYGELGDGTTFDRSTPVKVYGLTGAIAVDAGTWHTCALLGNGSVKCWGSNNFGSLGDGTGNDSATPVTVSGITTAVEITTGESHSCARLTGGAISCWGANFDHQLGQSSLALPNSTTPVAVPGITTATSVRAFVDHTCAALSGGTVKCWGANGEADFGPGQLGDGTTAERDAPVTVLGIGTATSVTVGGGHSCARLSDSTVRCWGQGEHGELGPLQVPAGSGKLPFDGLIGALAAGDHDVCVRATDAAGNTSNGTACAVLTAIDKTGPTDTSPMASLRTGVSLSGTALRVHLTWTGADNQGGSGIDHHELWKSTDGGTTWTNVRMSLTSPSYDVSLPTSGTVRFRVRGVDNDGNVGTFATGPVLTPTLIQEDDSDITYTGTWSGGSSSSYSGGAVLYGNAAGESASYTFTGRAVAFVTTRASTRGQVKVYLDGTLSTTLDTHSASTTYRVQRWSASWSSSGTHTLKLVAVGTASRERVDLDAIGVIE